ncbi:LysR family transcriptional regulator [Streptomyces sp. NPDC001255]|uniref:LysR family transcriptional regulator n=1 Tax=Streptomyces sp. NPDC001255 TaxID=3364550 RepID=UPI0036C62521
MCVSLLLVDLIRHLECFVAVAEESHFGRAARRLGMAQPPLSQRVQRLEKELGVRLFERTSRRVALTRAGQLLLPEARTLLDRHEALRAVARRVREGGSGLLRAGLPPDLAGPTVAALLAGFRRADTGVELEVRELTTAEQLAALRARELDVGLVHHPCALQGLALGPVLRRELGVLLAESADAAADAVVPLAALGDRELVLFPRAGAPALYDELLNSCAREGWTPRAVRHGRGENFVRGLVLSGQAVAFVPRAEAVDVPGLVWRPLAGAPLSRRHSAAWPDGREDAAVTAFAEAVTVALREREGAVVDGGGTAAGGTGAERHEDPAAPGSGTPVRPLHLRPAAEYWL